MTTGIYSGYNDYFYNPYSTTGTSPEYNVNNTYYNDSANSTLNSSNTVNSDTILTKRKKKVEKDDGNIGAFKAITNFAKGVGKFFTGMFTDSNGNFSLTQTLKTAAIAVGVGAVMVLTAGTAVPAMLMAAGIGVSAIGMGKAAYNIATAETDAEAEAAWQSFGSNTTAAGLAVVGAKSVVKSSAAAKGASTSEFEGISGYAKATKQVFKDSGNAIADSYKGVKTAYQSSTKTINGKYTGIKNEVVRQKNEFTGTVKSNYEKAVYDTKSKINDEKTGVEKELKEVKEKLSKEKNKTEIENLTKKQTNLEAKKTAIEEINQETSWESAHSKIAENENTLQTTHSKLAKASTDSEKAKLQGEITKLEAMIKYEKQFLDRRTAEAQHIRTQIESKQKKLDELRGKSDHDPKKAAKLESEIAELKARQDFEIPNNKIKADEIKISDETLSTAQKAAKDAKIRYEELNAESSINDRAYAQLGKVEQNAEMAKNAAERVKANNTQLHQTFDVQNGKGKLYTATEMGRAAIANPATKWFTIGIAGKQFGISSPYADFYSQLNSQEKSYFKGLSAEEKTALLEQYNNLTA